MRRTCAREIGRRIRWCVVAIVVLSWGASVVSAGEKIEISTDLFARGVSLQMEGVAGAVFEDNFFDVPPGQKRTIAVVDRAGSRKLVVRALNAEPIRLNLDKTETP